MLHIIGTTPIKRISFYSSNDNINLMDSNWEVVFSVGKKSITVNKGVFISKNEVEIYLETAKLQIGKLEAQLNVKTFDINSPNKEHIIKLNITNPDDYITNGLPH